MFPEIIGTGSERERGTEERRDGVGEEGSEGER